MVVLDARTGAEIYKVRVGGGGHTFSASPVAVGRPRAAGDRRRRHVCAEGGNEYKEIAKNDLEEMTLASPAVAGGAIYLRTESKLYKIAR